VGGGLRAAVLDAIPVSRRPRRRIPKTAKMILYASLQSSRGPRTLSCDAQAAELVRVAALPCTREHRKINFHQKNTYDLEDFFSCFCRTEPNALFLQGNITFERTKFSQFWLQNGQTPLLAQGGPVGSNVVRIWLNLDQIWSQLGEIGTQWGPIYIYKLPINRLSGRYVIYTDVCTQTYLYLSLSIYTSL